MRVNPVGKAIEIFDAIKHDQYPHRDCYESIIVNWAEQEDSRQALYAELSAQIRGVRSSFSHVSQPELTMILAKIEEKNQPHTSGIFLSALLNETDIGELDAVFRSDFLGYHLKPKKRLVVRANSDVNYIGDESSGEIVSYADLFRTEYEGRQTYKVVRCSSLGNRMVGGKIYNFGSCGGMGRYARGGLMVNHGSAESMACCSKAGYQFNFGTLEYFANEVEGGVQVNFKDVCFNNVSGCAFRCAGGVQINFGRIDGSFGHYCTGGVQINFGTVAGYDQEDVPMMAIWGMGFGTKGVSVNAGSVSAEELYEGLINMGRIVYPSQISPKASRVIAEGILGKSSELERILQHLFEWRTLSHNPGKAIRVIGRIDPGKLEDDMARSAQIYRRSRVTDEAITH